MSLTKKFASALGIALMVASASTATVQAVTTETTTTADCKVAVVGAKNTAGNADSRWTLNTDGTASAKVTVTGDPATCKQDVTIAVWKAPDADKGLPYSAQKLYNSNTTNFAVGTHTVSAMLPDCFYQVDLLRGNKATGENGTPVYPAGTMLASLHGGTKACVTGGGGSATPTPVTPAPVTPAPATPVVTPAAPTELPSVGIGSSAAIAAVAAAVAGTGLQYARLSRRAS